QQSTPRHDYWPAPCSESAASRRPLCIVQPGGPKGVKLFAATLLAARLTLASAKAEEQSKCAAAPHPLWGDGEHDDTAALNAWFRGETVIWAQTHEKVDPEIADRTFRLSSVVYISS